MNKKHNIRTLHLWSFPVMLLLVISMLLSCSEKSQETGTRPARIIPERDFISILHDVYLTDGLLMVSKVRDQFPDKDSIDVYIDVIKDHGYSKEDMDATLEHYFLDKPKRLIRIYDKMLAEFTELDTRLSNNPAEMEPAINNEWTGKPVYYFPDSSFLENPDFSIPLKKHAYFSLTFTVTVYPADQTENPGFIAWYVNADSAETGKRHFLPSVRYIKDGYPHTYNYNEVNMFGSPMILKGSFYEIENNPSDDGRFGKIEQIQLITSGGIV